MFFENDDKSYTMVDIYLNDRFLGQKDSYNYYDIDVHKILLFKKSNNEFIIRYNDVYYAKIIPLQLRIDNFYGDIQVDTYSNNNRVMSIFSDDKEIFKKCREIWNRINKLIGINNAPHLVRTTLNDGDEFIMQMYIKIQVLLKVILKI